MLTLINQQISILLPKRFTILQPPPPLSAELVISVTAELILLEEVGLGFSVVRIGASSTSGADVVCFGFGGTSTVSAAETFVEEVSFEVVVDGKDLEDT